MKNKFVILMLALLCLSCTGKSSKKDHSDEKEQSISGTVSLEFWETYSAREYGGDPMKASVITSKMGEAAQAVQAYYAANPDQHNYGGLLDILVVLENCGGGVVGGVTSEANQKIVSDYLALPEVRRCFPDEVLFMWGSKPDKNYNNLYLLYAIYDEHADGKAPLDGSVVKEARAGYSQYSGGAKISITMNSHGIDEWARLTSVNVGKSIAIVLDGYVYSSPVVNEKIEGGFAAIPGDFTMQEAEELAKRIKNGKKSIPAK